MQLQYGQPGYVVRMTINGSYVRLTSDGGNHEILAMEEMADGSLNGR